VDEADAFSRLYQREAEALLVFLARRTLDAEVALELTAETFAVALESWSVLGSLSAQAAHAWLMTVASRLYSRYLRRASVERRAVNRLGIQLPTVHEEDLARIESRAGLQQLRGALREQFSRLSNGQQQAVRLRVIDERSYDEIAARLGISEQTARARVSRGLRELAAALSPHLPEQESR
jgi:RNA polymerase sigma-70 factor (ECF subfamily)